MQANKVKRILLMGNNSRYLDKTVCYSCTAVCNTCININLKMLFKNIKRNMYIKI